jgi:hypothetical protein
MTISGINNSWLGNPYDDSDDLTIDQQLEQNTYPSPTLTDDDQRHIDDMGAMGFNPSSIRG